MGATSEFSLPFPEDNEAANVPLDMEELANAIVTALNVLVPVGSIVATVRTTAPTGWGLCDGSVQNRVGTHARLFGVIGTTYNTGGETGSQFRMPDFRGRVLVGVDGVAARLSANDALGNSGGAESVALTEAQIPSHAHAIRLNSNVVGGFVWEDTQGLSPKHMRQQGLDGGDLTANAGGNDSHTNMQPYQVVNWLIRL